MNRAFDFRKKKQQFAISIRKKYIEQRFKSLRLEYFQYVPAKHSLEQMVEIFDLGNNKDFNEQRIKNDPFILIKILLTRRQNFIRVSFKNSKQSENMLDEELYISSENEQSGFVNDEIELPKQYDFKMQAQLLQKIFQDMNRNNEKYKYMDKELREQMANIVIDYLKRNKYQQIAKQKELHISLLNFLNAFVYYVDSADLKNLILKWATGTEALDLVLQCISPSDSMTYSEHPKIYQLILKAFQHDKLKVKNRAFNLLLALIQRHDYDEIVKIQEQIPEIFRELIRFFEKVDYYDAAQNLETDLELLHSLQKAASCVICFLACYDEEVLKFMEMGAGYVGGWLIMQKQKELISQGLRIFTCIADAQEQENVKKGQSYDIVKHENLDIKKQFVGFVTRVICNTELQTIHDMNMLFRYPQDQTLVDILVSMFIQNEDMAMRQYILQFFQGICYYGDIIQEDLGNIEYEEQRGLFKSLSMQNVLGKMMNSQMRSIMEQIQEKQIESSCNSISELIGLFLEFIDDRAQTMNKQRDFDFDQDFY